MKRYPYLWLLSFFFFCCAPIRNGYTLSIRMIVKVPVADVRSNQTDHAGVYEYDPNQETQILEGETVLVHARDGEWAKVECPDQQEFTHNSKWEGYPGWVRWSALTSRLSKEESKIEFLDLPVSELRKKVLEQAMRHLGEPYLWGGRSLRDPENKNVLTGVDCSGLINWSFWQIGRAVPRDAHEQYMKAEKRDPAQLQPGDLLFLAKTDNPEKIVHVAFISGPDRLVEAPQTGETVREITFKQRFGVELKNLRNGATVGDRVIYFGTLFTDDR